MQSEIDLVIEFIDWNAYEDRMWAGIREAVERYCSLYESSPTDRVFQIAVWTDPQAAFSAVNFETRSHADDYVRRLAAYCRSNGWMDIARDLEAAGYTDNPADFKHKEFYCFRHPELALLSQLDYHQSNTRREAMSRIEVSLLRVMQRVLLEGVLERLPREETVWFGINSVSEWYDHITKA